MPNVVVEAIQRDGLRAMLQGAHDNFTILGTCDKPAVYLTDIPTTEMFHHGLPMARFTIRLPSHDRKLKLYGLWLRANTTALMVCQTPTATT